jgi:hypothetical protein
MSFGHSRFSSRAELSKLIGKLEHSLSQNLWDAGTHCRLGMCYQSCGSLQEAEEVGELSTVAFRILMTQHRCL